MEAYKQKGELNILSGKKKEGLLYLEKYSKSFNVDNKLYVIQRCYDLGEKEALVKHIKKFEYLVPSKNQLKAHPRALLRAFLLAYYDWPVELNDTEKA